MTGEILLDCRGVDVAYGQVQVLFGVDLQVHDGEMVALLGTNGAGKSTLLKAISGILPPRAGTITFAGQDLIGASPQEVAAAGVVQVPGGKGVFPTLTVGENLRAASWLYRKEAEFLEAGLDRVLDLFPILRRRFRQPAGNLSGGEQQMLTLAQAFLARPRLLCIDELSLGLAPTIVTQLLETVEAIHGQGVSVVLVEQSVNVALSLCQRAVFLEKGEVRFEGATADLLDRPDVLRSVFLKGAGTKRAPEATRPASTPVLRRRLDVEAVSDLGVRLPKVLEVRDLTKRFGGITAVDGVSFAVHQGEIIGLIGSNGAGKTTILDLISGFFAPDRGAVLLDGVDVTSQSPDLRARARLGRSFQDARLFPSLTVAETIATALERHIEGDDALATALFAYSAKQAERVVAERVDELIDLMGLNAFRNKFVAELSTGSRRIVDLACCLAHEPKVLLLDEPSSGIAQKETEALGPLLLRVQSDTGCSLLVIEHDMPLISSISDRLVALEAGAPIATGAPSDVLENPRVVASYLGTDERAIARSGTKAPARPSPRARSSNAARAVPGRPARRRRAPLVAARTALAHERRSTP